MYLTSTQLLVKGIRNRRRVYFWLLVVLVLGVRELLTFKNYCAAVINFGCAFGLLLIARAYTVGIREIREDLRRGGIDAQQSASEKPD